MSEGLERIGVHLPSLIAYCVNFVVLLTLLYILAYRPILRIVDRRRREYENRQLALEHRLSLLQKEEREAEHRRSALLAQSDDQKAQARLLADEKLRQTQLKADEMVRLAGERSRIEIEANRRRISDELHHETANLVLLAAERLLRRTLDDADHRRLVADVISALSSSKTSRQVRRPSLARIITAQQLTESEATELTNAIVRKAGHSLPISHEIDPDLISGLIVSIGDTIVDGSMRGRIEKLADSLDET